MSEQKRRSQSRASIERARREKRKRSNKVILVCLLTALLGYYILNSVAAMEKPPIGATFNIVLGCTIIAVSMLVLVFTIKRQYFPKKRKRTKHVFLDEVYGAETREVEENP